MPGRPWRGWAACWCPIMPGMLADDGMAAADIDDMGDMEDMVENCATGGYELKQGEQSW